MQMGWLFTAVLSGMVLIFSGVPRTQGAYTNEQCIAMNATCRFYGCFQKNVYLGECYPMGWKCCAKNPESRCQTNRGICTESACTKLDNNHGGCSAGLTCCQRDRGKVCDSQKNKCFGKKCRPNYIKVGACENGAVCCRKDGQAYCKLKKGVCRKTCSSLYGYDTIGLCMTGRPCCKD